MSTPAELLQPCNAGAQAATITLSQKFKMRTVDESQRDSGSKPKVARHELPWVNVIQINFNPNGVVASLTKQPTQPRWGWSDFLQLTQGSSCLATLGWWTQSLWDCQPERRAPAQ